MFDGLVDGFDGVIIGTGTGIEETTDAMRSNVLREATSLGGDFS